VHAHEGDHVETLTDEAAVLAVRWIAYIADGSPANRLLLPGRVFEVDLAIRLLMQGRVDDELWISRVRGAIIVTFHNYKQLREELAAQEGKAPTSENPSTYWWVHV
jgi:hypothetical protein